MTTSLDRNFGPPQTVYMHVTVTEEAHYATRPDTKLATAINACNDREAQRWHSALVKLIGRRAADSTKLHGQRPRQQRLSASGD